MNNLEIKEKRKWVFLQSPQTYCIPPCSCGNEDIQWSEYQKHIWCEKCQLDYIPEHNGVFDGPIMSNTARMFGMHFSRMNLETHEIEVIGSDNEYTLCINFSDIFPSLLIPVVFKDFNNKVLGTGELNYKTFNLENLKLENKDENLIFTEMIFNFPQKDTFKLNYIKTEDGFEIKKDSEFESFKVYILNQYLEHELILKSRNKTIHG